jgi:DNA-binding sugar fermentation-stimulating protein
MLMYQKKERKKERKKYNTSHLPFDEKIAYFPDGYRKNSTDVVSPRALKHVEELEIVARTTDYRAILCFIVQRPDVATFQPSNIDLTYKAAVQRAWKNGVEIYALQNVWNKEGKCTYKKAYLSYCSNNMVLIYYSSLRSPKYLP